jgi:hypothetical protein
MLRVVLSAKYAVFIVALNVVMPSFVIMNVVIVNAELMAPSGRLELELKSLPCVVTPWNVHNF